jgi:hypothetical protein
MRRTIMTIRADRLRGPVALTLCAAALALPGVAAAGQAPGWSHALHVRSVALNRLHHLGGAAVPTTASASATPAWLRALEIRARALNERYRLGAYAVSTPKPGFRWGDAAIGAGVAAAVLLLVAAAALAVARRGPRLARSA